MPADLSDLEGEFNNAEEQKARNFDPIPDGKYIAEVLEADIIQKPDGRRMLKWKLAVVGGPFDGRWLWRNNMVETRQNLGFLKKDLGVCGITLAKLNDLNERAKELVGLCVEIAQVTKGQFSNVYLNRLLTQAEVDALPKSGDGGGNGQSDAPAQAAPDSGQSGDPNDEIPF